MTYNEIAVLLSEHDKGCFQCYEALRASLWSKRCCPLGRKYWAQYVNSVK